MSTSNPLELVGRMSRKSAELFRRLSHPGFALFGDIAAETAAEVQGVAKAAADQDAAALQEIDQVLADGVVTGEEIGRLKKARRSIARSEALDRRLAGGAA